MRTEDQGGRRTTDAAELLADLAIRAAVTASRLRTEAAGTIAGHVESALVTIRIALAMLPAGMTDYRSVEGATGPMRLEVAPGLIAGLTHVSGPVWRRTREPADDGGGELDRLPRRRGPDLGAAMMSSESARTMAADPAGAALLADAIGGWSWVNQRARTTWSCAPSCARTLVAALDAGPPPHVLGAAMSGRLDADVVQLMADLGWTPHPRQARGAPAPPAG